MKAILIKTNHEDYHMGHYFLNNYDGFAIGSTNHKWCKRVSKPQYKLSKQNCDEIFGVVNVEKLADEYTFEQRNEEWKAFVSGFNKAMELNKEKLFTLEDMKAIFAFGHQVGMNTILAIQSQHSPQPLPKPDSDKLRDEVIQSLQQPTEIEVEVKMEEKFIQNSLDNYKRMLEQVIEVVPKLDSEGCLILKKI